MNRKIKYVFFLVTFITVNTAILIIAVLSCIAFSEYIFTKIENAVGPASLLSPAALSLGRNVAGIFGLLLGSAISVILYFKLYRYAERKWYIHSIFDFQRKNNLD